MKKVIALIILLIAAIFAVAALYFSKVNVSNRNNGVVLSYIPADACLVASVRFDKATSEIFDDYEGFETLLGRDEFRKLSSLNDTLLSYPAISNLLNESNIYFSVHAKNDDKEDNLLFLAALNKKISTAELQSILKTVKNISVENLKIGDKEAFNINVGTSKNNFFLFVGNNAVVASFSKKLLEKSLGNMPKISNEYIGQITSGGQRSENSPFNIYINHSQVNSFTESFYSFPKNKSNLLAELSGYSSLNMNFKSDALMFNGISTIDTNKSAYLACFLHQKPIRNDIIKALPQITAAYTVFGIFDYRLFFNDVAALLTRRGQYDELKKKIQQVKSETGIDLERDLKSYLGNEFALIQLSNQEKLAVIHVKNGDKVDFFLQPVSSVYAENIHHVNYSEIFYNYFGDALKPFYKPFYTVVDNYLILSNSAAALNQFTIEYKRDLLLNNTENFNDFTKYTANQSNISFFLNIKNFRQIAASDLKSPISKSFKDEEGLKKFYSFSWQWSSDRDHFFTNFYANFSRQKQQPDSLPKFTQP
ncbi:DUF3352 domain-containing protein [Pedobacter sp. HMF7647]|uniref:DUF3352 domain-containing protein n=1 Tax=Hufsiella arboris TaxID=2695275 RepID=A0A7K1YCY7_9SPHI|nr:DUF3352 domain-containing protein [Hufsiella arboris]MXV52231.1 DUF3352 domain-containing protein [Hufsiella arboris]